jgi:AraC family transcriptional regulator
VTIGPDDVAIVPAGLCTAWSSRRSTRTAAIWIDPPALRRFAEHRMHVLLTGPEPREAGVLTDPELRRVALALCDALCVDDPATAVLFKALAQIFAAVLVRRYAPLRDTRSGSGPDAERFRRVAAHVEANLSGRLSVDALAAVAAMSPSHFGHAFKAATDRTPHDFVTERRLERARVMLETEPAPIWEIAAACGFAD